MTLPPEIWGGVGSMAKIFANYLSEKGFEVTIAYYSTHGYRPGLNVSIRELPRKLIPNVQKEIAFDQVNCRAVGSYLPELEFSIGIIILQSSRSLAS